MSYSEMQKAEAELNAALAAKHTPGRCSGRCAEPGGYDLPADEEASPEPVGSPEAK